MVVGDYADTSADSGVADVAALLWCGGGGAIFLFSRCAWFYSGRPLVARLERIARPVRVSLEHLLLTIYA